MRSAIIAMAIVSLYGTAYAQSAQQATGKTRQDVTRELQQSRHDGTMTNGNEHPMSDASIRRAKAQHAASKHPGETAGSNMDPHDGAAGTSPGTASKP